MNPYARSVRTLPDYELEVEFENGEVRRFDVQPYLSRGIFVRLRDPALFQAAQVVAGSVEWPCGPDLSHDTVYVDGRPVRGVSGAAAHGVGSSAREGGA